MDSTLRQPAPGKHGGAGAQGGHWPALPLGDAEGNTPAGPRAWGLHWMLQAAFGGPHPPKKRKEVFKL